MCTNNVKMTEQEINEVILAATKARIEGKELSKVIERFYTADGCWRSTTYTNIDNLLGAIRQGVTYRVKPKTVTICGVEFTEDELPIKERLIDGNNYCRILSDGHVGYAKWIDDNTDRDLLKNYNVFLTPQAALKFNNVKNTLIERALRGEFA